METDSTWWRLAPPDGIGGAALEYTSIQSRQIDHLDHFGIARFSSFMSLLEITTMRLALQTDLMTVSFQKKRDGSTMVSYPNFLMGPSAMALALLLSIFDESLMWPALIPLVPQLATNFWVSYPLVDDALSVFVGQTTDFFPYGSDSRVYSETSCGIAVEMRPLYMRLAVGKPWFPGYFEKPQMALKLLIGMLIGIAERGHRYDEN